MIAYSKPPILVSADLVRSYYYLEFDQVQKSNSGVVVDDSCYELMFVKEKNIEIISGDQQTFSLPPCYTLNYLKGPFRFKYAGSFTTFCIKLQPWMNASFIPTKEPQLLNLTKLYPSCSIQLHEAFFKAENIDEKVKLAEKFLLALNIQANKEVSLIKDICNLIYQKSGNITVTEIADTFNIYRQKLNAIFKQEVKYTLKTFINNVRIRECLAYKLNNPEVSLTEISYRFGYYDQAHFIRSFKKACGVSPSDYVKSIGYSFVIQQ